MNNYDDERKLHKQIRGCIKDNKKKWLNDQLSGGGWGAIKSLKKGPTKKPMQVRGADNMLVSSEERADTLADYFEKVQWKVRFANLTPSNLANLGDELPVSVGPFLEIEVRDDLKFLSVGKCNPCLTN